MNRIIWTNVGLLVLVVGLAAVIFWKPPPSTEPVSWRLSTLQPGAVRHVRVRRGDSEVTLERTAAGWRITAPAPYAGKAAADARVQPLLGILGAASSDVLGAMQLKRYDLDPPQAVLEADGERFEFGALNEMLRAQYVLAKNRVFLVSPTYGLALTTDPARLAASAPAAP